MGPTLNNKLTYNCCLIPTLRLEKGNRKVEQVARVLDAGEDTLARGRDRVSRRTSRSGPRSVSPMLRGGG